MYFLLFIRKQSVLSVNVSAINCSYAQKGICPSSKLLLTVQSKWKNRGCFVKAKRLFRLWHFYSAQVSGVIYSYNVGKQ